MRLRAISAASAIFLLLVLAWSVPAVVPASSAPLSSVAFHLGFPRLELHDVSNSSPVVSDINGDGHPEILVGDGSGCVWGWDYHGNPLPGFPWTTSGGCSQTPRIDGPLAVGDVDGDGAPEIVAGTRGPLADNDPVLRGKVFIWNANGSQLRCWPREMAWDPTAVGGAEVYSVALGRVDGNGLNILAGTSNNSETSDTPAPNLYAWNVYGLPLPGYPTAFRTAGIWGLVGAADLNGDGRDEVITGRDQLYVHAYGPTGQELPGWPARTYVDPAKTTYATDLYVEFTTAAPVMGDLAGTGSIEIAAAGRVRDPLQAHAVVGTAVMVFEPNGQRRTGWTVAKLHGAPLSNSASSKQAPALADLNGDGKLEIVVPLMDGTIRAYREDGALLWTYDYAQGRRLFAGEPVIGDINGDGQLDILFGTYSPDGTANSAVSIQGLDASGRVLPGFPLALTAEKSNYILHGVRAGLALADLDGNGHVELIAASLGGALYAWDLPGTLQASRMPWPMSRHDLQRSGSMQHTAPKSPVSVNLPLAVSPRTVFLPAISHAPPACAP